MNGTRRVPHRIRDYIISSILWLNEVLWFLFEWVNGVIPLVRVTVILWCEDLYLLLGAHHHFGDWKINLLTDLQFFPILLIFFQCHKPIIRLDARLRLQRPLSAVNRAISNLENWWLEWSGWFTNLFSLRSFVLKEWFDVWLCTRCFFSWNEPLKIKFLYLIWLDLWRQVLRGQVCQLMRIYLR